MVSVPGRLPRSDPPGAHPQLLHRRAHRPRQVDAGRPAARGDPHHRPAADDRARCSTRWTSSARRASRSRRGRCASQYDARRRPDLRPQPDRHPRPRRLHLRGEPQRSRPARARSWSSTPRQGIEAQTLANVHLALAQHLVIIPVINKIDLPRADPEMVMDELEDALAIPREEVILASAKEGTGVAGDPRGDREPRPAAARRPGGAAPGAHLRQPLRPVQGRRRLRPRRERARSTTMSAIRLHGDRAPRATSWSSASSGRSRCPTRTLTAGEVGLRGDRPEEHPRRAGRRHADHRGTPRRRAAARLPASHCRWSSPASTRSRGDDYPLLRDALEKLHLNDASFVYEPESSVALGFGFRCGFLGLLHMEIVQERLEREFDLDLIAIRAERRVPRRVAARGRDERGGRQPRRRCRSRARSRQISEPWVERPGRHPHRLHRADHGARHRRGAATFVNMEYLDPKRVNLHFEMPLGRADRRLLRPAEEPLAGLREPRLHAISATGPATWSSSTCWSTASRSTRSP